MAYLKLITVALLLTSGLVQLSSNETWWFIQNVNLIFHEAGHIIFGLLGNFIGLIGGTLMEILIPITVTLYFAGTRQFFSAAFGCWWLSTALLSISIYAADAQERTLPLLGGNHVLHDWYNILTRLHLLQYDDLFGYAFWLAALASLALLVYFTTKDKSVQELLHRHALR